MIIGIDASRANHSQKTGVEWYAWHIIEELKKIKMPDSVRVILYTNAQLQGELAVLPANWQVKILCWPPRRLWTQIRLSWEMFRQPPDVLFIPAHVFPLIHPQKTVMTVHDTAALSFPKSYNWFERWYSVWSAKFAVKNLWQIIVPTEFVKTEIVKFFQAEKNAEKIKVIHHGFDPAYSSGKAGTAENVLARFGLTKPYIMSVGRLEEKKNTKRIIQAFNLLKEKVPIFKLVLVGQKGYGYLEVENEYNKSPYKNDIFMPGWLTVVDTAVLLQNAGAFVFPSLYEGFGIPVLEAFAARVPVVASKGSSLEEVGANACVYADAMDFKDIAANIFKVLENNELRAQMIVHGTKQADNFSWQLSGKKTYETLIGE